MARNGQRIEFATFGAMAAHLDTWAGTGLNDAAGWEDALMMSRAWQDYSARNQILLVSYGADGPVAGPETWRLVPSTMEGRSCAVRAGEHGYPVRVPVTTGGTEPDPYVGGHRPTRAAVERWEWRPVFDIAQLARRPAPDTLIAVDIPDSLRGDELVAAVRKVASATVRGRLPKSNDPSLALADAAIRLRRGAKRPPLDPVGAAQVAWLVSDRVGHARTDRPPMFDPAGMAPRERWERLQDVLEPARKLTAALGVAAGVDLIGSPLPRMEIVDDRVVPAGRRHRLPAASLEQLPIGRWVSVGPYTAAEWAARGEQAAGNGAFLRLNKSAYLVAVETGDGAAWRLEDVASRTGHGLLASGNSSTLDEARSEATTTVRDRYPTIAASPPDVTTPAVVPGGARSGWEPMPGAGRATAELRHLSEQVTVYVLPGPGGRWLPAVHSGTNGVMERLPLQASRDRARDTAEAAGMRLVRASEIADPARADPALAAFADSDTYTRSELPILVGARLDPADAARLATAPPAELVELLGAAGFSPATTVAVLAADHVDATTAASLLPMIGVPIPDSIVVLNERWDLPRTSAAELLDATAAEMRAAGCTPVEIMASRPRDVLRTLPDTPHLWELAAGTMADAGHPTTAIVSHLVAHAPTPDAFAAGLTAVADTIDGLTVAARQRAHPDQLAATSEAYGLSPGETAAALTGNAAADIVLNTIMLRSEGDTAVTATIAADVGMRDEDIDRWLHPDDVTAVTPIRVGGMTIDTDALLAALPPIDATRAMDPIRAFDALTAGIEEAALEPTP